ncbi:MAG: hypothetical protein EOM29_06760 [Bacteroidia bacterium]|nr:hypothetical protein [Bacteroidia bacterium]
MLVKGLINSKDISLFLNRISIDQYDYEKDFNKIDRKRKGVFLTNSLSIVENLLNVVEINSEIFSKKILEPSCGQGIIILKLISDIYLYNPNKLLISEFISNNLFFVDLQKDMVDKTISNIKDLYKYLFNEEYSGRFNGITWDFTDKIIENNSLFEETRITPFLGLYKTFDYVIGNPPYVTLYGRRDKKETENQRVNYLKNYSQFPNSVKNGKLNLVMLFLEHSLDFLKDNGRLSFIIDVSFFETAYKYTRRFLLEQTIINELQINIKDFEVASGQVIIKVTKCKNLIDNDVKIIDHRTDKSYFIKQSSWDNKNDEYKFRYNGCVISKQIIDKVKSKNDKTILQLFPNKNLRTCVMLLDMEDKFTFFDSIDTESHLTYPYYQGSKSLKEKYGKFEFKKYFHYNKPLQDSINEELKIQLEKKGIKNKKRLGLGEITIYNNPKIYIRQSAKEIIASVDLEKSSANNSLYVFTLRDNSEKTIDFLYFLCGLLNSDLITYYAQEMNIIRFSQGKQPQIKIGDLGTIFIPSDLEIQKKISQLSKSIYSNPILKQESIFEINSILYRYYQLSYSEIDNIKEKIKVF